MTKAEYNTILTLLEQIQQEAYNKYTNGYMHNINAHGGNMKPIPAPAPFHSRVLNMVSPEAIIDKAIQETNIAYVYQLNHAVTLRAKLVQNQPPKRTLHQMIIDGVDYMADSICEMRGIIAPQLANNATMQQIIDMLQNILKILQELPYIG